MCVYVCVFTLTYPFSLKLQIDINLHLFLTDFSISQRIFLIFFNTLAAHK